MQTQGDFGENLAVVEVAKSKNPRLMRKWRNPKAIISDTKDAIRNSLLRVANTISGFAGIKNDFERSRGN